MDGARRALLSMAEIQFAAGARDVLPVHEQAVPYSSWSQARAAIAALPMQPLLTRVRQRPRDGRLRHGRPTKTLGVVRPDGRHWQLENLSVHDGSLFPTSIGANPQLSVYGLTDDAGHAAGAPAEWARRASGHGRLRPRTPMLARLQQALTLGALSLALAWGVLAWRAGHPGWALGGVFLIVFGYALVLALEFALLHRVHGDDPAPRADPRATAARLVPARCCRHRWSSAGDSPSAATVSPTTCRLRRRVAAACCWCTVSSATAACGIPGCSGCRLRACPSSP